MKKTLREIINKRDTYNSRFDDEVRSLILTSTSTSEQEAEKLKNRITSSRDAIHNILDNLIISNDIISELNSHKKVEFEYNGKVQKISVISALCIKSNLEKLREEVSLQYNDWSTNIDTVERHEARMENEYSLYKRQTQVKNIELESENKKPIEIISFADFKENNPKLVMAGLDIDELNEMKIELEDSLNSLNASLLRYNVISEADIELK